VSHVCDFRMVNYMCHMCVISMVYHMDVINIVHHMGRICLCNMVIINTFSPMRVKGF